MQNVFQCYFMANCSPDLNFGGQDGSVNNGVNTQRTIVEAV